MIKDRYFKVVKGIDGSYSTREIVPVNRSFIFKRTATDFFANVGGDGEVGEVCMSQIVTSVKGPQVLFKVFWIVVVDAFEYEC